MVMNGELDITGQRYSRLTAVCRVEKPKHLKTRGPFWLFNCDCGCVTTVSKKSVVNGHTRSCGCLHVDYNLSEAAVAHCKAAARRQRACVRSVMIKPIETGTRFGMLLVHSECLDHSGKGTHYNCICDCGTTSVVRATLLRYGQTKSCGCQRYRGTCQAQQRQIRRGSIFGSLTALTKCKIGSVQGTSWRCRCSCGNAHVARVKDLNSGNTRSCGCRRRAAMAASNAVFASGFSRD